jgi:hypothetical protein
MLYALLAAVLLAAVPAEAQQTGAIGTIAPAAPSPAATANPGEAPKKGRIAGKAVHAITGEPIRKASITLSLMDQGRQGISAVTDNEGLFAFENVEPGRYRLQGEKAGFVRSQYGTRSLMAMGGTIEVAAGGEVKDLVFKITPAAVITGRVVDEDGEPIERVQVTSMRRGFRSGGMNWMPMGSSQTNDRGEFRISGLAPDKYVISAQVSPYGPTGPAGPTQQGKEEYSYPRTYFPGVESTDQAQAIAVQPGQEFSGVQIQMKKTRVFRIKGKYTGSFLDATPGRTSVQIRDKTNPDPMMAMMFGANPVNPKDGSFEVLNVRPGAYKLQVMQFETGRPRLSGSIDVVVGKENVEGVVIGPQALATLTGRISIETDPQQKDQPVISPKAIQVQLMPADPGTPFFGQGQATVNDDGTFKMEGISPDTYRINVYGGMGRTFVKSLTSGGRDIRDTPIDLSGGAQVEVVISTRVARIDGSVEKASPNALPGQVVFERVGATPSAFGSGPLASVSQAGTFSMTSITPGEYRVYAFEEVDFNQVRDPEFLKKFAGSATTLKLGESESKTLTLKQIPLAAIDEALKGQ